MGGGELTVVPICVSLVDPRPRMNGGLVFMARPRS